MFVIDKVRDRRHEPDAEYFEGANNRRQALDRSYHQKNTELEWNQTDGLINGVRLLGTAQQRSETLSNSSARCCRGVGVVMICIVV